MKTLPFWIIFLLLVGLAIIFFGTSPAKADTPPPPVVKIGEPSKALVKIGEPYIALRALVKPATPWPSRWDIRKPRH